MADVILPKRILVVQIGKIGDMVLTTPLFSLLKKRFSHVPGATLTILSSQVNKDIISANPFVDDVIIYKKDPAFFFSFIKNYFRKFDIWIDTKHEYSRTSELLLKAVKPAISLGYNSRKAVFDIDLNKYLTGGHAVNINTAPMKYFNEAFADNPRPEIYIKEDQSPASEKEGKKILLNISAGSESRYIEAVTWKKIINELSEEYDMSILLTGLKKDRELIEQLENEAEGIKYIPTRDILSLVNLIRQCDYVITTDTSIVHIASAFNKPQLVFYPKVEWNFKRFAPLSDKYEVIFSDSENKMDKIDINEVKEKLKKLIIP